MFLKTIFLVGVAMLACVDLISADPDPKALLRNGQDPPPDPPPDVPYPVFELDKTPEALLRNRRNPPQDAPPQPKEFAGPLNSLSRKQRIAPLQALLRNRRDPPQDAPPPPKEIAGPLNSLSRNKRIAPLQALLRNRRDPPPDAPPQPILDLDSTLEELTDPSKSLSRNKRNVQSDVQQYDLGEIQEPQERLLIRKLVGHIPDFVVRLIGAPVSYIVEKIFRFVLGYVIPILIPRDVLKKVLPYQLWGFLQPKRHDVSSESESHENYVD